MHSVIVFFFSCAGCVTNGCSKDELMQDLVVGKGQDIEGDDGGRDQGGNGSGRSRAGTQSTARTMSHGTVERGRRHGGGLADDTGGRLKEM